MPVLYIEKPINMPEMSVLQSITEYYRVLQSIAEYYRVL